MKRASANSYTSSVWDRMIAPVHAAPAQPDARHLTLDQFKRVIARDLEALLNTRIAVPEEELAGQPYCSNSIVNFGLADFAQLCLTSSEDRKQICDRLKAAIERHETRLCNVRAHLVKETGAINRLSFVVSGQLRAVAAGEQVRFDILLEPSSLHYSIR